MFENLFWSVISGIVMGSSTVLYIVSLTKNVQPLKRRMRFIAWIGIPLGCLMGILSHFIGVLIGRSFF